VLKALAKVTYLRGIYDAKNVASIVREVLASLRTFIDFSMYLNITVMFCTKH
jgi:hypothetical protein